MLGVLSNLHSPERRRHNTRAPSDCISHAELPTPRSTGFRDYNILNYEDEGVRPLVTRGFRSPSAAGIDVFFGIRYAASPAGAARQRFRTFPLSPRNGKVRPLSSRSFAGNRDGGKCRIAQGRKIGSDGRSQDEMLEQDGAWRLRLCKIAP
jgi:hypothetical protein